MFVTIKEESSLKRFQFYLKAQLSKAATNLHNFCLKMFKAKAGLSSNQVQVELPARDDGSEEERLDNQNRFYTFAAKIPSNEKFYIPLTPHTP